MKKPSSSEAHVNCNFCLFTFSF